MSGPVTFTPVDGGICWWQQNRGRDCEDATTGIEHPSGRFIACQHHREMVADLIARHTATEIRP